MPKPDMYFNWEKSGKLEQIKEFIKECSRKLVTQKEMCEHLRISESAFTSMKKRHKDIYDCIFLARLELKKDLVGAIYKKAVGYEIIDEDTIIEDNGKGKEPKRKITKTRKQVGPDTRSAIYLLTKHFGREFSEKRDELELMEARLKLVGEEWNIETAIDPAIKTDSL